MEVKTDVLAQAVFADRKIGFLQDVTTWNNHRPLLLLGLMLTEGKVIEFGSGFGSTPYLKQYCQENDREFYSYESSKDWCKKLGSIYVTDWDKADIYEPCGLLFVDHAPGEHRHVAIRTMKDMADIICIHDTEEGGAGNYMLDKIWNLFRFKLHYNRRGGGAGASLVSNHIDVSKFAGHSLNGFNFEL